MSAALAEGDAGYQYASKHLLVNLERAYFHGLRVLVSPGRLERPLRKVMCPSCSCVLAGM